jgi:hypothetical protein
MNPENFKEASKMKKEYIKPFALGLGVGAVVLLIVIFSAGWVVTNGSAEAQAKLIAQDAVIAHLAPIAVAQFMQDPDRIARLKELKEMDSWKRGEYVQNQGWVTMPGSESPNGQIDYEVAKRIMELQL